MNTLYKLEKKFGRFAIPNLYFIIIACSILGYILRYLLPNVYDQILLVPYMVVVRHQYWRLFTWFLTIPYELSGISIIFLPINLFFYYYLGKSLEAFWGRFMYNLYVIGGALLTDILVLILSFYYYGFGPSASKNVAQFPLDMASGADSVYAGLSIMHYMLISIFLAYTIVGGDNMVYLYFLIPLKMKWLGYLDLFFMAFYFITGGIFTKVIVFSFIANYFIAYAVNHNRTHATFKDRRRQKQFVKSKQSGMARRRRGSADVIEFPGGIIPPGTGNPEGITVHKCAVCGRTEIDSPDMEFRFCSKCNGNYEYCSEHLYTHTHIT